MIYLKKNLCIAEYHSAIASFLISVDLNPLHTSLSRHMGDKIRARSCAEAAFLRMLIMLVRLGLLYVPCYSQHIPFSDLSFLDLLLKNCAPSKRTQCFCETQVRVQFSLDARTRSCHELRETEPRKLTRCATCIGIKLRAASFQRLVPISS